MIKVKNILSDIHKKHREEILEEIVSSGNVKVERIVSRGHETPEGRWYDQDRNEFVVVLNGEAELLFEEGNQRIKMIKGDYIVIPAHVKHRVERTHPRRNTIWLAVYY